MIQAYKKKLRYWIATRIGSLETAETEYICEVFCPDCGMKTALDSRLATVQTCYFCDADLSPRERFEGSTPNSATQPEVTPQTQPIADSESKAHA